MVVVGSRVGWDGMGWVGELKRLRGWVDGVICAYIGDKCGGLLGRICDA